MLWPLVWENVFPTSIWKLLSPRLKTSKLTSKVRGQLKIWTHIRNCGTHKTRLHNQLLRISLLWLFLLLESSSLMNRMDNPAISLCLVSRALPTRTEMITGNTTSRSRASSQQPALGVTSPMPYVNHPLDPARCYLFFPPWSSKEDFVHGIDELLNMEFLSISEGVRMVGNG